MAKRKKKNTLYGLIILIIPLSLEVQEIQAKIEKEEQEIISFSLRDYL